jgi:hypothetical protein
MLYSGVVDVGIAVVYVFVLVSLLVSALNELVAGLLKQRAKALWRGIGELIRSDSLRDAFYAHPMIKSLGPPVSGARLTPIRMSGPSYIPPKVFALTLLDILQQPHAKLKEAERALGDMATALRNGNAAPAAALARTVGDLAAGMPATEVGNVVRADLTRLATLITTAGTTAAQILPVVEEVKKALPAQMSAGLQAAAAQHSTELADVLRVLAEEAAGSVERLGTAVETWFDTGMDRVSGWYKRWTQLWQLVIGLILAIALNINIVTIGLTLWNDIPLRTAIVAEAEKHAQEAESSPRLDKTRDLLKATRLPLGWPNGVPFIQRPFDWKTFDGSLLAGWLLTAIGASFGAPFWFDLLNRFVKLRSGGPRPDEARPKVRTQNTRATHP